MTTEHYTWMWCENMIRAIIIGAAYIRGIIKIVFFQKFDLTDEAMNFVVGTQSSGSTIIRRELFIPSEMKS